VDRLLLARSLEEMDGNQFRAARPVWIGRETLRSRLRKVGIHMNRRVEAEAEDQLLVDLEAAAPETGHSGAPVTRYLTSRTATCWSIGHLNSPQSDWSLTKHVVLEITALGAESR
jgi:hypothetical protein